MRINWQGQLKDAFEGAVRQLGGLFAPNCTYKSVHEIICEILGQHEAERLGLHEGGVINKLRRARAEARDQQQQQVEALDVADAAAPAAAAPAAAPPAAAAAEVTPPAAAAPAAAPPAAAAAEGKPAAVSTLASGLTPALAAIAAGLFHVAPAEGFDQILSSLLSWGALAETPKLLALAA